jgi:hypothetical protein
MVAPSSDEGFMRLVCGFVLMALLWLSPVLLGSGGAPAFMGAITPASGPPLLQDAKIVCGDCGEGYTCRQESGAIRRGKMPKIPGSKSGSSSGGLFGGGSDDPDALPPAPGADGASQAPNAAPATCPVNSELLGGHCIAYNQTCRKGLAAAAPPQACPGAEEKLVCDFRPDGLKDCCCRTYSKY